MSSPLVPLYGFLQGDTIGLLILAYEDDTIQTLAEKLKSAASVRVLPRDGGEVWFNDRVLRAQKRVGECGLTALDRFDVRWRNA